MLGRPAKGECHDYYYLYIDKVPDGDIFTILEGQLQDSLATLAEVSEDKSSYRYAPDKWSLKQVMGHVCDVERLFQYRALVFARCDKTPLPSFEQDDYVRDANFDERTLADLTEEFRAVRASTLAMFRSFEDAAFLRTGTASEREFTVRSVLYIIAGHERHHMGVIRERYLNAA
jgi:uncharacterized damage-inducible protein DinB